jgi:hypothetical protein
MLEDTTNLIRVRRAKEGVEVKVLRGVFDQVPCRNQIRLSFGL